MNCFISLIGQLLKKIIVKEEIYICIKIDITGYIYINQYTINIRSWLQSYLGKKRYFGEKKTFLVRTFYLKSYHANIMQ